MKKRPTSVTIIAWLLIVIGGITLVSTIATINNPIVLDLVNKSPIPVGIQYALTYIGLLIMVVSGIGMLKARNWARLLYSIWGGIGILVSILTSPDRAMMVFSFIAYLIIVFFLYRPRANEFFTLRAPPTVDPQQQPVVDTNTNFKGIEAKNPHFEFVQASDYAAKNNLSVDSVISMIQNDELEGNKKGNVWFVSTRKSAEAPATKSEKNVYISVPRKNNSDSLEHRPASLIVKNVEAGASKWGSRIAHGYIIMLLASIGLGYIAGDMINEGGSGRGESVFVFSWFFLLPIYIIADAIVNARFFGCSLRAAFLPLVQGFVIWKVTGWGDPFGVSQSVAIIYLLGSLVVVAIARSVRKRKIQAMSSNQVIENNNEEELFKLSEELLKAKGYQVEPFGVMWSVKGQTGTLEYFETLESLYAYAQSRETLILEQALGTDQSSSEIQETEKRNDESTAQSSKSEIASRRLIPADSKPANTKPNRILWVIMGGFVLIGIGIAVLENKNSVDVSLQVDSKEYKASLEETIKAAEKGIDTAQLHLGILYYSGEGVAQDYRNALKWFQRAANQGDSEAQAMLGIMYKDGLGVSSDYETSFKWFKLAAEQGLDYAQSMLGFSYKEGRGVKQDYKAAFKWFKLAAEQGYESAPIQLGFLYANGFGVTKDFAHAFKWYKIAAEQGNADAQGSLGFMYFNGQGVDKDYEASFKWFKLAAEQGHALAQINLGQMYDRGVGGTTQNYKIAFMWYILAAEHGDERAEKHISRIEKRMTITQVGEAKQLARECVGKNYKDC